MTFTFDATLSTNRDKLRSYIGDMQPDEGPYPKGLNFSNEQLDEALSGRTVNAAYIVLCRMLATAWTSLARRVTGTSLSVDATGIAEEWRKNAREAVTNPIDGSAPPSRFRVFNGTVNG